MTDKIEIVDQNVKTDDILYKPKFWRWDSWQFHALVIIAIILCSVVMLTVIESAEPNMFGFETNTIYVVANVALNWVALAYAIYIYKIYDDTKQKATAKMQESGIRPISIEEGLGQLLHQVKKASNWVEENREGLEKMYGMSKKLNLEQIIASVESMGKMLESMQEHGFNQERFEKLFVLFEKVDLDKVIGMVESWNESEKKMRQLDEMEASLPKRAVCHKHPNVTLDMTGNCDMCDLERKYMDAITPSEANKPYKPSVPPLKRLG